MYSLRDSEGKFVARARTRAAAHRSSRRALHLGASVNRAGGQMTLVLAAVGNPDFGQPRDIGVKRTVVPVSSFAEASEASRAFISQHGLGGGNWAGGQIFRDGKQVAHVSYNGRVWKGKSWKSGQKPLYEPGGSLNQAGGSYWPPGHVFYTPYFTKHGRVGIQLGATGLGDEIWEEVIVWKGGGVSGLTPRRIYRSLPEARVATDAIYGGRQANRAGGTVTIPSRKRYAVIPVTVAAGGDRRMGSGAIVTIDHKDIGMLPHEILAEHGIAALSWDYVDPNFRYVKVHDYDFKDAVKALKSYSPSLNRARSTSKTRHQLEFAGYKFTSGPGGTVIQRETIDVKRPGDYGADPLGDGTYRMVPSGDVVSEAEKERRLGR